eukprot:Nitzschia sp. Nitz4//scaffold19_size178191//144666//148939//NITZ4_002006-RA/size178191-augustus-gene-0.157-mRNA-1//-1//CDS//3329540768//1708//frame0
MQVDTASNTDDTSAQAPRMNTIIDRSKWLADAKRFNAQKIRRRMEERRSSTSPVRTPKLGKPQLVIAVSVSEDPEDVEVPPAVVRPSISNGKSKDTSAKSPLATFLHQEDGYSESDASAWAMMEHYQVGGRSPTDTGARRSDLGVPQESSFWDRTIQFETYSLHLSSDGSEASSLPSERKRHSFPTKVSESQKPLVDTIGHPHEYRKLQQVGVTPAKKGQTASSNDSDSESSAEEDVFMWRSPEPTVKDARPTPARVKADWLREREDARSTESPPTSLLQESVILSDGPSTTGSAFRPVVPRAKSTLTVPSMTPLPKDAASSLNLPSEAIAALYQDDTTVSTKTQGIVRSVSEEVTEEPVQPPVNARTSIAKPQRLQLVETPAHNLKERATDLEQALRTTTATPRGTILEENPLKTLLDRNQTLVKEVRFADSTCVELSSKISVLEAENRILQEQLHSMQRDNHDLRHQHERQIQTICTPFPQDETTILKYSTPAKGSFESVGEQEVMLRRIVSELKAEVSALTREKNAAVASPATVLLSDIENLERVAEFQGENIDNSFTSRCLVKSFQAQAQLLKNQKQMEVPESPSVFKELNDDTVNDISVSPMEEKLTLDLSKAQDESDFLGRQLGKVQDKLDKALQELDAEKAKSKAADNKWRQEASHHLEQIAHLESQLARATRQCQSPEGEILEIEHELSQAKTGLVAFRRELEELITADCDATDARPPTTDSRLALIVEMAMGRMKQHYSHLQQQVDNVVEGHCTRIEKLTQTVAFLRSSLLFEADSVSAEADHSTRQAHSPSWRSLPDDDMFAHMEEARPEQSPTPDPLDEASATFEEASRLLSDDSTLESILKANGDKSVETEYEQWKKPLEAAIKECQRVRDRSMTLKQELQSEKVAFRQLEMENRRLVEDFASKESERKGIEKDLLDAKTRISHLQAVLDERTSTMSAVDEKHVADEIRYNTMEMEKGKLQSLVESLKLQSRSLEADLSETRAELSSLRTSYEQLDRSRRESLKEISILKSKASTSEDELFESKCALEDMRRERAELKAKIAASETEVESLQASLSNVKSVSEKENIQLNLSVSSLQRRLEETQGQLGEYKTACAQLVDEFENQIHSNERDTSFTLAGRDTLQKLESMAAGLAAILENNSDRDEEQTKLQAEVTHLRHDLESSEASYVELKSQVQEEKSQNAKLYELLRLAEVEMDRSATQIREMSTALSKLQQQESDLTARTRLAEQENATAQKELERIQREVLDERVNDKERAKHLAHELEARNGLVESMQSTIASLESKGSRLREYVKKLTVKCEEWESSYERQARSMEKLKASNLRTREKANAVAAKYKQLAEHVKSKNKGHTEDRDKRSGERHDLQMIHTQLEKELEKITQELSGVAQE